LAVYKEAATQARAAQSQRTNQDVAPRPQLEHFLS
jgi:hypothetical protein